MNTADVCTILADADRRRALHVLFDTQTTTIDVLAAEIAARDQPTSPDAIDRDGDAFEHAKIALVHNHLPRLESHGVIEYDTRNEDVVLDDAGELEQYLEDFDEQLSIPVEQQHQ